jgi:hypothetical protein
MFLLAIHSLRSRAPRSSSNSPFPVSTPFRSPFLPHSHISLALSLSLSRSLVRHRGIIRVSFRFALSILSLRRRSLSLLDSFAHNVL